MSPHAATATGSKTAPQTRSWWCLLPASSVLLCAFSLPPFNGWGLGLIQWMPLIWWAARETPWTAAAGSALTGIALGSYLYFGAAVLDVVTWAMASLALGLAFAVFGAAVPAMFRHAGAFAPYALGALWATLELAMATARLPFSNALTLTSAPSLLQAAAIGGAALIAMLVVAMQCAWVRCALPGARIAHWRIALSTLAIAATLTVLGNAHRPQATDTINVSAAQTDLHPFWYVHAEADGHLGRLQDERRLIYSMLEEDGADLLVWPEVPFARFDFRGPASARAIAGMAELRAGNDLGRRGQQYNAVLAIDANGAVRSRHTKSVLLPRLERKYQISDTARPHGALTGQPGALICFESAFSAPARALSLSGAGLLTITTSDAYAGPSVLPALHGAYAILRAIENRRAVVRAANAGPSMIVSERGTTLASGPLFSTRVVSASVNVIAGASLYARHAALVHLAIIVIAGAAIGLTLYSMQCLYTGEVARSSRVWPLCIALTVVGLGLTALQIYHHGALYAKAHERAARPALGFVDTIDPKVSYASLRSAQRKNDLPAATAALLRRFGIDQSAADVGARLRDLESTSVFRIGAQRLIEDYGLTTTPWNDSLDHSSIPCVAQLNDDSVVLISNTADQAIELFSPAEGAYSTVPRAWLVSALNGPPACVIGRIFAWDLAP